MIQLVSVVVRVAVVGLMDAGVAVTAAVSISRLAIRRSVGNLGDCCIAPRC